MRVASALLVILGIIAFLVGCVVIVFRSLSNDWPGTFWGVITLIIGVVLAAAGLIVFFIESVMEP